MQNQNDTIDVETMRAQSNVGVLMSRLYIPIAIVLSGAMIALALYASGSYSQPPNAPVSVALESPLREGDRNVYGAADAPITIVEFSDYECPYCAQYHTQLKRLVDESNDAVNWEYRHLPLTIHPTADEAAVLGECVRRAQGNESFWAYTDAIFQGRNLGLADYRALAMRSGLSEGELSACEADPTLLEIVETDMAAARAYGGRGTPFSVVRYADGSTKSFSGALPYSALQQAVYSQ